LARFKPVHFGLLWERWRDRYPNTEYHPPLAPVVELFGPEGLGRASLRIESEFPVGRCWYLAADGHRLVQVQPDRLILNWRKLDTDTEYPSYNALRNDFMRELGVLLAFIAEYDLGEFQPVQCELIYFNHLFAGQGWNARSDLANVLAPWSGRTTEAYLPDLEDARLAWQYRFVEQERPLGRLHVSLQSAFRTADGLPLFVLELTGRGAPIGKGVDGVLAFTDRAHEWIVNGFTAITTEHMHTIWERQR
jgi:uncharacterized protein (TIGR04255 family)